MTNNGDQENRRKTAYIWRRNAHDPPADAKQRGQRAAAGRHRVHELTAPSTFVVDALLKGSLEDGTTPSSTGVTVPDFKLRCSFVTGLIFNGLFFLAAVRLLPDQIRTEGQKGWVLTLCSCTVMSTASIPFLVQYAQMGGNIAEMELLDSDWAVVFSSFFLSYLWMDAVMGILYYKSAFGIVSGWVHHFFYFVLVTFTIYANIPGAFMVACLLEVSTIFLSSGHIWKKLRCDWAFGATFFLTRIAFHPYFAWTVHVSWPGQYYWILAIGVYPFHLWWFYGFIRQQVRLYQDRRKPRVEGDGEVGDGEANEGKWEKGDKCEKEHMAPSGPVPQDSRVLEVEEYEEERTARDAGDHV
ncbi:hypothetical protein HK101_011066 [Irineochytrium annulatum]|nr:hypothetical protein HK101_011066 [Irineochytrium annulatum]